MSAADPESEVSAHRLALADRTGSRAPGCKCIPPGAGTRRNGEGKNASSLQCLLHTRVKPRALKFLPSFFVIKRLFFFLLFLFRILNGPRFSFQVNRYTPDAGKD